MRRLFLSLSFFFTDTAPTEIYTLSLHDALPISRNRQEDRRAARLQLQGRHRRSPREPARDSGGGAARSEEHTSELQSRRDLVCRLLLEKKKKNTQTTYHIPCTLPTLAKSILVPT